MIIKKYRKEPRLPIPPQSLRYRVHGSKDVNSFLKIGRRCAQDLESVLKKIGRKLNSFTKILDFGCGCGRTLRWFADYSRQYHFYGTDFDREAISWCRKNISFARFITNNALPRLKYSSKTFDLVYAVSVFTHLDEDYQHKWLNELKRVTKTNGILLLSVQGSCREGLSKEDINRLKRKGFVFLPTPQWQTYFPSWYQATYHTKKYILDSYSRYFRVLGYIPRGLNNHQDIVILENR